jgi:hypothetical protein
MQPWTLCVPRARAMTERARWRNIYGSRGEPMTQNDVLRDICAMREDLLVFERKYGVPTETFYESYSRGEEPSDPSWVLDWSEWAAAYRILQERLFAVCRIKPGSSPLDED